MAELVAVVVTYNRLDKLRVTLERLLAHAPEELARVVVLDNASEDGTGAWLAAQDAPRLTVLSQPENLGGAGGFEQAMRETVARFDPDWLVLMDDDARPEAGTLAAFHARARDSHAAWAAAVYYPSGRICDMNRPWINPFRSVKGFLQTLLRGRNGFHMGSAEYAGTRLRDIDGGSFVGLFLSRAGIQAAGYPDGRLFLYGDDVLYTLGLSQAGGRVGFDPSLRFEHDCETLAEAAPEVMQPLWKVYYFHRNQVLVYRRAAGPLLFWPVLALRALGWWRRAGAYGAQKRLYQRLVRLALQDGLARRLDRPRSEIMALSSGSEYRDESGASGSDQAP